MTGDILELGLRRLPEPVAIERPSSRDRQETD